MSILTSILTPIADIVTVLWWRRRWIVMITGLGLLLAVGYALSIPNEYESTARLMPPDQQSLATASSLSALTGAGSIASSFAGGAMNQRTPGAMFIGILNSDTVQNDIINHFDLRSIYHCTLYSDARKILTARTTIEENPRNGIISITVMDRDRYRARDLSNAYIEELDKLLNAMSTSTARRERIFLEERLKSLKSDLDVSSRELSQFSSRNATLNPQNQGQALLESATRLQGELITAQSELSGLKAMYSDDNVRVREARAKIDELQSQLRKMGGIGGKVDGADQKSDQVYPSIRELPILGVTYSDLYRQENMQESIYETLTRQYELAKVEEAKEIPTIKILDEPELPERKSLPHRMIIVVLGTMISAIAGITWVFISRFWKITNDSHPIKVFGMRLLRSIRGQDDVTPA
jgi:uncharacterized protein involved in exopolysaccharide biosynthesis